MRDPENIRAVELEGPDMMGFICWEGTPRNVTGVPSYLPSCERIGVFVNPSLAFVLERVKALGLNRVQLHGSESTDFCNLVRQASCLPITKAISVRTIEDINAWEKYQDVADMLLFDTKCKCVGGSGEQFDWDILQHYRGSLPFLLAGGIGPGDETRVLTWHHPMCIGIDINSRFEVSPAYKDVTAIHTFIQHLRQMNNIKHKI